ncbi:formimidoylglutamase [Psychrobium sp. nBUS_13]|uniref:formimidoylglutamase n=1 Tax=Psychrobium sp. nBUS_13 TaxID=3395319 RepID=UPI003EBE451B
MTQIQFSTASSITPLISHRENELKIGQQLLLAESDTLEVVLETFKRKGAKFILLGIPEDIGPRANLGRGGSTEGWQAFLSRFLNLQQNNFIRSNEIGLLGHIITDDLQRLSNDLDLATTSGLNTIRELVSQLDERVSKIIKAIASLDLIPIIIGGGHNNAYGILKGMSQAKEQPMAAVNLDPHTDFRNIEGRHSGNGFSYAANENLLSHYFSLGMHELKNSAANINSLNKHHFPYVSYQQIYVRREVSFEQALEDACCYLNDSHAPVGIELDVDAISFMPASAYTNVGVDVSDAQFYVHTIAQLPQSCYLHLAEGAPCQHPSGFDAGVSDVGQGLAALVSSFIQSKQDIGE